jgi:hypothetical protein
MGNAEEAAIAFRSAITNGAGRHRPERKPELIGRDGKFMLIEHVNMEYEKWHIRTFSREIEDLRQSVLKMFCEVEEIPDDGWRGRRFVMQKEFSQYSMAGLSMAIFLSGAKYELAVINPMHIASAIPSKHSLGAGNGAGLELTNIVMNDATVYTVNLGLTEVFK